MMKLLCEKNFKPIRLVRGDTIRFSITMKGIKVTHETTCKKAKVAWNTMRVYWADEFEGLDNCYLLVGGYKANL